MTGEQCSSQAEGQEQGVNWSLLRPGAFYYEAWTVTVLLMSLHWPFLSFHPPLSIPLLWTLAFPQNMVHHSCLSLPSPSLLSGSAIDSKPLSCLSQTGYFSLLCSCPPNSSPIFILLVMLSMFIYHWPRSPSQPVTISDSSVFCNKTHSSYRVLGQWPFVREGEGVGWTALWMWEWL